MIKVRLQNCVHVKNNLTRKFPTVLPYLPFMPIVDTTPKNIQEWKILDSFATSQFVVTDAPVTQVRQAMNPMKVSLPDGAQVQSIHRSPSLNNTRQVLLRYPIESH